MVWPAAGLRRRPDRGKDAVDRRLALEATGDLLHDSVVCSMVDPGCSSTEIIERPRSVAGMKSVGSFVASAIEPAKKAMPARSVIQRWPSALRSSHR